MLTQARLLQDGILREVGRNLTVSAANNPFHHTRNAVPLDGGDIRSRQPWVYVERVEAGRSAGRHRASPETARSYVRRFVFEHFFPC